jgi:hypothetical protein
MKRGWARCAGPYGFFFFNPNQETSKESVILVQKYLMENPTYPLKKKIQTNLKQQIIPKLCEGNYQLQTSTLGYTLFDAKVVPFNGKMNWLRFKTKYSGIVKYDNCEESVFRKDLISKVSHYLPLKFEADNFLRIILELFVASNWFGSFSLKDKLDFPLSTSAPISQILLKFNFFFRKFRKNARVGR